MLKLLLLVASGVVLLGSCAKHPIPEYPTIQTSKIPSENDLSKLITSMGLKTPEDVNRFVNQIPYKSEEGDVWSSPAEFFSRGNGDCDEYAIAKHDLLKQMGYKPSLFIVFSKEYKDHHLVAEVDGKVLDNAYPDILIIKSEAFKERYKIVVKVERKEPQW